ncbi:hypothetical protein BD324DRAFT_618578, partial [Kockovaella imperatae]
MLDVLLPLWLLGAFAVFFYRLPHYLSFRSTQFLPTLGSHRLTRPIPVVRGWRIDWTAGQLSIETKDYNSVPRIITERSRRLHGALKRFYFWGSIAGPLGLAGSVLAAVVAAVQVWQMVWQELAAHSVPSIPTGGMSKRGLVGAGRNVAENVLSKRAFGVVAPILEVEAGLRTFQANSLSPLIPGITMPFSHLPTLVLVLVTSQLFHELGHALSAYLDGVSPAKLSLNLHYGMPSMMVSFSSSVDRIPTSARIRLASSGPWHNLAIYLLLGIASLTGFWKPLWADVGEKGLVVDSVEPMSALYAHIRPGDLITHLDDLFVGGTSSTHEHNAWARYLTSNEIGDLDRGWCVPDTEWRALHTTPCSVQGEIAFEGMAGDQMTSIRCLSPHPILDSPSVACPCTEGFTCVRPSPKERVLRIQVASLRGAPRLLRSPTQALASIGTTRTVLWSGDRRDVLQNIKVGTAFPRLFPSLMYWLVMFFNYVSTISLSLFFFNLLPLPGTDGAHLLTCLLELFSQRGNRHSAHANGGGDLDLPLTARLHETSLTSNSARSRAAVQTRDGLDRPGMVGQGDLEAGRAGSDFDSSDDSGDDDDYLSTRHSSRLRQHREGRWQWVVRKGVEWFMISLGVAWIAGWGMIALLRS